MKAQHEDRLPHSLLIVDAATLLEDPELLPRLLKRGGTPVLGHATLASLEKMGAANASGHPSARLLIGWLRQIADQDCTHLPNGVKAKKKHRITKRDFRGGDVYTIQAEVTSAQYESDQQLALQYGLIVLSSNPDVVGQANAAGARAVLKIGKGMREPSESPAKASSGRGQPPQSPIEPFSTPSRPVAQKDELLPLSNVPAAGDLIRTKGGRTLKLGSLISAGGEGQIFLVCDPALVCKVYHPKNLTRLRKRKIELMLSRPLSRPGLCWPADVAHNAWGEFVGYLMPKAEGRPIQTTMFVKPVLLKTFPAWKRTDLVNLCVAFLEHVDFLHKHNIIIGDINPLNLLVTADSTRLSIVDTDSFQVEGFPCPVGTINFTPPELQGTKYASLLRTKEHELFAVATMLFMILHPGKPPYSQQGGGSPAENIKRMEFPYGIRKTTTSSNAPQGPWFRIWKNLPLSLADKFDQTFRLNKRVTVPAWLGQMRSYLGRLKRSEMSTDLFPSTMPVFDGVLATCGKCGEKEASARQRLERLRVEGKDFLCTPCVDRIRLASLAKKSQHAMKDTSNALDSSARSRSSGPRSSTYGTHVPPPSRPQQPHTYSTPPASSQPPAGPLWVVTKYLLNRIF